HFFTSSISFTAFTSLTYYKHPHFPCQRECAFCHKMFTKNKHPAPQSALPEVLPQKNACGRRFLPSEKEKNHE
ncbi:MAG: hypothetical protein WAW50_10920, partial [Trichococcus flocculiformis]